MGGEIVLGSVYTCIPITAHTSSQRTKGIEGFGFIVSRVRRAAVIFKKLVVTRSLSLFHSVFANKYWCSEIKG